MSVHTSRLADGGSDSWTFSTAAVTDVEMRVSQTPVNVDVESKLPDQPDSEYSRIGQFERFYSGPKTVTETGTKTLTISTGGVDIRVSVTNNSGSPVTPEVSVTPSDQPKMLYEDGKAMVDAKEVLVEESEALGVGYGN